MSRILQQWCQLAITRVKDGGLERGSGRTSQSLLGLCIATARRSAAQNSVGFTSSSRRMLSCTISTMAGRGKGRRRGH